MLTEDNSSSVEAYLEKLRSNGNGNRQHTVDSQGTPSVGDAIRGAVQRYESGSGTTIGGGREEDVNVRGLDGTTEGPAPGTRSFTDQLRASRSRIAGNNSGTNQYQRPATEATRSSWRSGISGTVGRYKEALRKDKVVDADKKKKAPGKTLNDTEAIKMRPKLIEYFVWQSEHLDQFIIATSGGHDDSIVIWSDLSYDEIEILVDYLIQRGKKDARTATAVRYASVMLDRIRLGLIILPRMYKTAMIYFTRGMSIKLTV